MFYVTDKAQKVVCMSFFVQNSIFTILDFSVTTVTTERLSCSVTTEYSAGKGTK